MWTSSLLSPQGERLLLRQVTHQDAIVDVAVVTELHTDPDDAGVGHLPVVDRQRGLGGGGGGGGGLWTQRRGGGEGGGAEVGLQGAAGGGGGSWGGGRGRGGRGRGGRRGEVLSHVMQGA